VANQQSLLSIDTDEVVEFLAQVAELTDARADEVSAVFVDQPTMVELNSKYRGREKTTDVLSFPADDETNPEGKLNLGDIVICSEEASRQARTAGHNPWTEIRILLIHGFLHLLGMDHPQDHSLPESGMEREEQRLRAVLLDQNSA